KGKSIRSYKRSVLAEEIGFILQDPFLFGGTIIENIVYGNTKLESMDNESIIKLIIEKGLGKILERFYGSVDIEVENVADNISLGQKQLIAFLRVMLRDPKLLILDEATANIDTVTENLLEEIIGKLDKQTTKIIIAHRLNTIEKADEIFFIANGEVSEPVD